MRLIIRYSLLLCFFTNLLNAQFKETSKWKALFSVGVNSPSKSGFIPEGEAQSVNFPTVNIGVQHMFKKLYGVKLDLGFNRMKSGNASPEYKLNYTRINAQFVLDPTDKIGFIPHRMRTILHAGPGLSFVRPLSGLQENNQTYLNLLTGLELHYAITEKLSLFTDVAYILGVTSLEDYSPSLSGLGAFNGNVINITFGVAISLSGCQYCD